MKLTGFLVAAIGVLASAPVASAAVIPNTDVVFPPSVTVGDQNVAGTLTIVNVSSPPTDTGPIVIDSIKLTPACGIAAQPCPLGLHEPGRISIDANATGSGTACPGVLFTAAILAGDEAQARYTFTPAAALSIPIGQSCTVSFTFDVLKSPAFDNDVALGIQTSQVARTEAHFDAPFDTGGDSATDHTTVIGSTLTAQTPTPTATPTTPLGWNAVLTGLTSAPPATGSLTFNVYGPGDPLCSATPLATLGAPPVTGNGTYASNQIAPPPGGHAPGTYRVKVSYSGDANNLSAGPTACGAPGSTISVPAPGTSPTITGTPAATATGQRAAALKKCKKKKGAARKKCKKKASKLPV